MKILVAGSGGREHALVWKLAQSNTVSKVWAAPGNSGIASEDKTEIYPYSADFASADGQLALIKFAQEKQIDLTVVGPEAYLAAGIVDRFRSAGLKIIGADQNASRLESSKVFSKSFMEKYGVRAAKSRSFSDAEEALAFAKEHFEKNSNKTKPQPLVIKADGLAAGKGVVIAASLEEAENCISSFMKESSLGAAGNSLVFEEYLEGREVSVLAAVSVNPVGSQKGCILPFISARDHKSRFEWGKGPNTGGMGSIAPVPDFTAAAQKDFENSILLPTLKGIENENMDYRGFIFFGLMVNDDICSLLEYNVRLGDPETQAVLPLMDSDFLELCLAVLDGSLAGFDLKWKSQAACVPVLTAQGYPGAYRSGDSIRIDSEGLEQTGAKLFFAGVKNAEPPEAGLVTSGGRVLGACALGASEDEAREKAYQALNFINFEGMGFRKDIGLKQENGGHDNE